MGNPEINTTQSLSEEIVRLRNLEVVGLGPELLWLSVLRTGNKARNLAWMMELAKDRKEIGEIVPPPGMVLLSDVGRRMQAGGNYSHLPEGVMEKIKSQMDELNKETNEFREIDGVEFKFGDKNNPLLVSARSGAKWSMPGKMATILNIGISRENIEGMANHWGEHCAWTSYRNYLLTLLSCALGKEGSTLHNTFKGDNGNGENGIELIQQECEFLENLAKESGIEIKTDPWEQLEQATSLVYRSWESTAVRDFCAENGIPHDKQHTAVTIQSMVYGNLEGEGSGSGVAFSIDEMKEKREMEIDFAKGFQGWVTVDGGVLDPKELVDLPEGIKRQLETYMRVLEEVNGWPQDVEFVVEKGKLIPLQARDQKLGPEWGLRTAAELWQNPDNWMHVLKKTPQRLIESLEPRFRQEEVEKAMLLGRGGGVGSKAVTGRLVFVDDGGGYEKKVEEYKDKGEEVVLVSEGVVIDLPEGVVGEIVMTGSGMSHGGITLSTARIAGALGFEGFKISNGCLDHPKAGRVNEGEWVSVDGFSGKVYLGKLGLEDKVELQDKVIEFLKARSEFFRGSSMWNDLVINIGGLTFDRMKEKEVVVKDILCKGKSGASRAITQELVNGVIPEYLMMPNSIIKTKKEEGAFKESEVLKTELLEKIKEGWQAGNDVTIRAAHRDSIEGKSPWIAFKVNDEEGFNDWFDGGREFNWRYGGLERWKETGDLTELIVSQIHEGKMDDQNEAVMAEHFIVGMELPKGAKKIKMDIILGTSHLRTFDTPEESSPEKRISLHIAVDGSYRNSIGQVRRKFGKEHVDLAGLERFIDKVVELNGIEGVLDQNGEADVRTLDYLWVLQRYIKPLIGNLGYKIDEVVKEELKTELLKLIKEGDLPNSILKELIKYQSWRIVDHIEERLLRAKGDVFEGAITGVAAIDNLLGSVAGESKALEMALEFQGRVDLDNDCALKWLKVYGMKGLEEWLRTQGLSAEDIAELFQAQQS